MISFAWPWVFVFLPIPLIAPLFLNPYRQVQQGAMKVPFFSFLTEVDDVSLTHQRQTSMKWLGLLMWIFLVIAGSGPLQLGPPIKMQEQARSMMLAVDLSGSMRIEDMREKRTMVSRLEIVKRLAVEFIDGRVGDRMGLVLFGSQAYLRAPLTFDRQTVADMLKESSAGIAGEQTAIGDAIGLSLKRLRTIPGQDKSIVLLTDGRNNAGKMSPDKAADLAAKMKIKIYTIGLGREDSEWVGPFGIQVPLAEGPDEDMLKMIAEKTGGRYFRAQNPKSLQQVYQELSRLEPIQVEGRILHSQTVLYPWFLSVALLLGCVIVFLEGRR